MTTRHDQILATARYFGRDAAIAVLCGAPDDVDHRHARWVELTRKSGWSAGEAHAGWSAAVDAFHDRIAESAS